MPEKLLHVLLNKYRTQSQQTSEQALSGPVGERCFVTWEACSTCKSTAFFYIYAVESSLVHKRPLISHAVTGDAIAKGKLFLELLPHRKASYRIPRPFLTVFISSPAFARASCYSPTTTAAYIDETHWIAWRWVWVSRGQYASVR